MEGIYETLGVLQLAVYGALAVAALVLRARRRDAAAGSLAGAFSVLALAVLAGRLLPEHSEAASVNWARKLLVAGIALFPYLLYRFTTTFSPAGRLFRLSAAGLTAAALAGALLLPRIPEQGEARPAWFEAYVSLIVVQWLVLSVAVAVVLWRGGSGQATVARRRMRTLGVGAVGLAVALAMAGLSGPAREVSATQIVVQLVALGAAPLFLIGFAPPRLLRMAWRRPEEAVLRDAEIGLMGASAADSIARLLLPRAARLVGGRGAVLVGADGGVLGAHGLREQEARAVASAAASDPDPAVPKMEGFRPLCIPLRSGSLVVETTPFMPFFGRDEIELLRGVGVMLDLALERVRATGEVRRLNGELQQRVRELEAANAELEAFSYSVSHDLRAPLRAVDGFARILVEDHVDGLPADVRRHLGTIRKSASHMGELVDDLLAFSRLGRQSLAKIAVQPGQLAREALAELGAELADRRLEVRIGDLPGCLADPTLLRQVFLNLLSNALKFTRGREVGIVDVGWRREDGTPERDVYFVQDNGVGFDMRYAHKLFGVFQRLHRQEDFEGTGVGLAIVQRIVRRHGGDVWAQAEVGRGARFEFVLEGGREGDR